MSHHLPLLVLSVYAPGSIEWFDLQSQWLHQTTDNYQHLIYGNNLSPAATARLRTTKTAQLIGTTTSVDIPNWQHLRGLQTLCRYAQKTPHRGCLVLDSDCFPIINDWETKLQKDITNYDVACMVRPENLDTFPHPAVCYTQTAEALEFDMVAMRNLKGEVINDVACVTKNFFPLLRTNRVNVHPVVAGLYYNMFYHHVCGSRAFRIRSFTNNYYSGEYNYDQLRHWALHNFPEFLAFLRGEHATFSGEHRQAQ